MRKGETAESGERAAKERTKDAGSAPGWRHWLFVTRFRGDLDRNGSGCDNLGDEGLGRERLCRGGLGPRVFRLSVLASGHSAALSVPSLT
jgi:hypothetical protein